MQADADLLEAWRNGDAQAGERLFDRYYEAVERFFRNKLRENIDDLVQQTFEACLRGRERVRGESFRAYLFGAAHNVLRGHFRRSAVESDRLDWGSASVFDLDPGPSTIMVQQQELRVLLEGLRRIPLDYQIVLELRFWEGMRTAEIAEVLGVPAPTARSRLRRAKELLRSKLAMVRRGPDGDGIDAAQIEQWALAVRELMNK